MQDPKVVTDSFVEALRVSFGSALKGVWLFGSRARGDAHEDSDYDMLVVVEGSLPAARRIVQDAEWTCMEKWGILVASVVYTPEIWSKARNSPLGWNILREGTMVA